MSRNLPGQHSKNIRVDNSSEAAHYPGATEDAEQLEFQAGRRAPYSQVGDWVMLAPIRHPAARLYWALAAHINASRDDTAVWPTQDALAEMLGYKKYDKVEPYLAELVAIDAISIKKSAPRFVGGLKRQRSIYIVNQSPPPGYTGLESLRDFYTARKARIEAAQAGQEQDEIPVQPQHPQMGVAEDDTGQHPQMGVPEHPQMGVLVTPSNGGTNKTKNNQTKENPDEPGGGVPPPPPDPPAARTAGDVESVVTDQLSLLGNQQTARAIELLPLDTEPVTAPGHDVFSVSPPGLRTHLPIRLQGGGSNHA